jgi:hypothetical protein
MFAQIEGPHGGGKTAGAATDDTYIIMLLFIRHGFDPLEIFDYTPGTLG